MRKVHGWRRPVRWARNIFLGIFGVVTVVLLGAYLFFETGYGRGVLRNQIESRMAAGFIGGAKIGGLEGNPLSELVLTDVVINDASKQPAIKIKRLTVKLPLMPLISHQLRVDKIIADDLDVLVTKDKDGRINLANMQNPAEPSTWNIKLPNVEVHRGHVRLELGAEPVDLDNIELYVDAALPVAGPIDASLSLSADWRQKKAPIDLAANIHLDDQEVRVHNAALQLADIDVAITQLAIAKGPYAMPLSGVVSVYAPAPTLRSLAPQVNVPGDVGLLLTAAPDGRLTHVTAAGSVGAAHVRLLADADVQAKLARGVLLADDLDITTLSNGKVDATGGGVVAFDFDGNDPAAEFPTVTAMVTAWGKAGTAPATEAVIAVSSQGSRLRATATAVSDSGLRARVAVAVFKDGEKVTLERSNFVASTPDARRASQGMVPLRGALDAHLHASGSIAPRLDLAVDGYANGRRLRMNDISASAFKLRIDAKHVPSNPVGSARVEISDLKRADMELGKVTVAVGNRPDGKLQVTVRSQPKQAPWLVDLDALVTTGKTIVVDLQRHFVRAAGGSVWKGQRGTLTISPREIALVGFESHSGDGRIAADATFVRAGRHAGDLTARVDAKVDLSNLKKMYRGKLDARIDVRRTRGHLAGTVIAKANGIALDPKTPGTFDADVNVQAAAGQLVANVSVGTPKAGTAAISLDVDAPHDIADANAWGKLGRNAIRTAQLKLDGVDLAEVARLTGSQPMAGIINGDIKLTPAAAGGVIRIRGVQLQQTKDLGSIEADLRLSEADNNELRTQVTARLQPTPAAIAAKDVTKDGTARFLADARFATPDRLFDPAAWRRLGINAFRGATLRAERLAFQPGTLERLGILSNLRGELAVGAELDKGLKAARISVNFHHLRGGVLAQPIAVSISAIVDEKSSRVMASVVGDKITLVQLNGHIPLSLEQLRVNPDAAKTAPLAMTATIDRVPAVSLLKILGTTQVSGGTLDGKIKIAGTVANPTVDLNIVGRDVTVPPEGNRRTQGVKHITIAATWDGTTGKAAVDADETGGGKLKIRAMANPDDLAAATASFHASKLDLAPLMAFMPGPAGALGGQMDASFTLKGADPRTTDLAGNMHIRNGRIPIAPAVGTLFQGDVKLGVKNRVLGLDLTGKLGRGDIKLSVSAPLEGATPKSGKVKLTLRKVQLIGTTEPIISGTITADVARVDDVWQANMLINRMDIDVPEGKGKKLATVGAPSDLVYGGQKIHHGKNKGKDVPKGIVRDHDHSQADDLKKPSQVAGPVAKRRPLGAPVADVRIKIANVFVESKEARGLLGGNLRLTIGDNNEVGIIGRIAMTRGVLDLFNRRYQVDKANLSFDGSPDPMLDVRITHDFPEVTTVTEVRGRMSKPQLVLSSNPGTYTQAELLGFLLGGEPGGDPENAQSATSRVANAGASFLAGKVADPIRKALPVDIDVLRYESASSTSSAAVTVGTWITDTLFLAYRRHLEARPDENTGEGELEYWIGRRVVLEAVAGDRGVNGLDLLWRRRW